MKTYIYIIGVATILLLIGTLFSQKKLVGESIMDVTYSISGRPIQLVKQPTKDVGLATYFGNEIITDLNNDGNADSVFLITQERTTGEVLYYLVAALKTDTGYVGSQAMLIGDRIAPQTTEVQQGYTNRIIINYAVRKPGENMTASPSVGKSMYVLFDPRQLDFGELVQNFEGESNVPVLR